MEIEEKKSADRSGWFDRRFRTALAHVLFSYPVDLLIVVLSIIVCLLVTAEVILDIKDLQAAVEVLEGALKQDCNYSKLPNIGELELAESEQMYHDEMPQFSRPITLTQQQVRTIPSDYEKYSQLVKKKFGKCPPSFRGRRDSEQCLPRFEIGQVSGRGKSLGSTRCKYITTVPEHVRSSMNLSSFYHKYTHAYGIPVLSSNKVSDEALQRACYIVRLMLADRKDIRDSMYNHYARVGVIGIDEVTTQIPEHAWLDSWWNWRARGLGGTTALPISTGGEENLLCFKDDRYFSEDIFLHEFSHSIHDIGANKVMKDFDSTLERVFQDAKKKGLWYNTYAVTNRKEYFAEGVQSFFNANSQSSPPNGIHNHVNTRSELKEYDPKLYDVITQVFPCENPIIDRCEVSRRYRSVLRLLYFMIISILMLFVLEVVLKIVALGKGLLQTKTEVVDVFVVLILFLIEVFLSEGFSHADNEFSRHILVVLGIRLWRISKLVLPTNHKEHENSAKEKKEKEPEKRSVNMITEEKRTEKNTTGNEDKLNETCEEMNDNQATVGDDN